MMGNSAPHAAILVSFLLVGCGVSPPADDVPASDPTDAFYRPEPAIPGGTPAMRWHLRQPARLFVTSLRPWDVQAHLPTPYLFRVTRNHQPWADRIYDKADLVFDFGSLQPIQPQSIEALVGLSYNADAVRLTLGGWDSSYALPPETVARIYDAPIVRTAEGIEVRERPYSSQFYRHTPAGQIDGEPVVLHCGPEHCRTDLIIPRTAIDPAPAAVDTTPGAGIALEIEFHRRQLAVWPEVRRKSLCFAGLSIQGFRFDRVFGAGRKACSDVARRWPVAISAGGG